MKQENSPNLNCVWYQTDLFAPNAGHVSGSEPDQENVPEIVNARVFLLLDHPTPVDEDWPLL